MEEAEIKDLCCCEPWKDEPFLCAYCGEKISTRDPTTSFANELGAKCYRCIFKELKENVEKMKKENEPETILDEIYFSFENKPEPVVFEISDALFEAILYGRSESAYTNDYDSLYKKLCFLQGFLTILRRLSEYKGCKELDEAASDIAMIGLSVVDKVPFKLRRRDE